MSKGWVPFIVVVIVVVVVVVGAIPVAASVHHLAWAGHKKRNQGKLLRTENYFFFY